MAVPAVAIRWMVDVEVACSLLANWYFGNRRCKAEKLLNGFVEKDRPGH